jgi:hypothetical protein
MQTLYLQGNFISASIPSSLGNLADLQTLQLSGNKLTGSIPDSFGNLAKLRFLEIFANQLSGRIPATLTQLTNLERLWLYNNQLTGYPSGLKADSLKIFPNPMSDVPYDVVRPASIGLLSNVTLVPFLETPVNLEKRQVLSFEGLVSATELYSTCQLSNVQGADVAAGCIAGIYNKLCTQPWNADLLSQCQKAYDSVFAVSIFKTLGRVCPAWKNGPRSPNCASAIASFTYTYKMGVDPVTGTQITLKLGSSHAKELVGTLFASTKYAPCFASTCKW